MNEGAPTLPPPIRCWRCGHHPETGERAAACRRCEASDVPPDERRRKPGFIRGLGSVVAGLKFLNGHPRLWGWILVPLILNAAIFGMVFIWMLNHADRFIPDMQTEWWAWIDWLRVSLEWVLPKLMAMVVFLAAMIGTLLISGIVNAPFYDLLSEKTEDLALDRKDPGRPWAKLFNDIAFSTWAAILLVARQVVIMAVLFLLSFTAIGAPLFMLAGFFFTGLALQDITLARKRYPAGERAAWGRRHVAHLIGTGLLVNLLPPLAPLGVVGATLTYLDDPNKG